MWPLSHSFPETVNMASLQVAGMAYLFPVDIDIKLEGEEFRRQVEKRTERYTTVSCPVYNDMDSVEGQVCH